MERRLLGEERKAKQEAAAAAEARKTAQEAAEAQKEAEGRQNPITMFYFTCKEHLEVGS